MMKAKPLLILKTGHALPEVRVREGDFEDWFHHAMDPDHPVEVHTVIEREPPADPGAYAGVVVTGSAAMVSHGQGWCQAAAIWLRMVVENKVPVLGVCFGHQLLAHALGGEVGPNPRGRQMGTQPVEVLPASASDALFAASPKTFNSHTAHVEAVLELPRGAVQLATSPRDSNHAFRYGSHAWGIQFHPEFSTATMDAYLNAKGDDLRREGQDPEQLMGQTRETPIARSLLKRFALLALQATQSAA